MVIAIVGGQGFLGAAGRLLATAGAEAVRHIPNGEERRGG